MEMSATILKGKETKEGEEEENRRKRRKRRIPRLGRILEGPIHTINHTLYMIYCINIIRHTV